MDNTEDDIRYVQSCIDVFRSRVKNSITPSLETINDFLVFLEKCKLQIVKKDTINGGTNN